MSPQPAEQIEEIKYFGFPPLDAGTHVIGLESINNIKDEIRAVHQEHWDETEVLYLERPMDPDYDLFCAKEAERQFVLFTVRDPDGRLIGNLGYFLGLSTHHTGMLQAKEDFFFVTKEYRKTGVASELLQYAEKHLIELGVKLIGMSDKSPCGGKSLEPFLTREGYKKVAIAYVKEV